MNPRYICIPALLVLFISSCAGVNSPVTPETAQADSKSIKSVDAPVLWGIWDIEIDPDTKSILAVPLRGPSFTANITGFVNSSPGTLVLAIDSIDPQPDYIDITVDVGIKHPFPGLDKFIGFDVMGVFMGDGTEMIDGPLVSGTDGQQLLNADGYTLWFNSSYFMDGANTIFGYTPGAAGSTGYNPTAELNPYKYFADGLVKDEDAFANLAGDPSTRGAFTTSNINHREYQLRFPSTTGIKFQYTVIAHWEANENTIPTVENFPPDANCDEAILLDVEDSSTAYFVNTTTYGGDVILGLSPWDWSAPVTMSVVDEYEIHCYSDAWSGAYDVDMTAIVENQYHHEFHAQIPVEALLSGDPLKVWIKVSYPLLDYSNDFGVPNMQTGPLSAYFMTEVEIGDEPLESDPIAVAGFDPVECYKYHFYDDGSNDPDGGTIDLYEWDWNDDGIFDEEGSDVEHYWKDPGTYYVQMRVTDDEGITDTLDTPLDIVIEQGDPSAPSLINTLPISAIGDDVEIQDGYAYIAGRGAGLIIVDIDPPESAYIVNTVDPGSADDVAVDGDYAYIADWMYGLHIIDINPPESAFMANEIELGAYHRGVAARDGYAYITDGDTDSLHILDVDPPGDLSLVNSVILPDYGNYIALDGEHAIVSSGGAGTIIIDVVPPETASIVNTVTTPSAWDVVAADGYAYLGATGAALNVIDVDPFDTAYVTDTISSPGYYPDCAISNDFAYMSGDNYPGDGGFIQIIDVSDPTAIFNVANMSTDGRCFGVDVMVCYAYMTTLDGYLYIIQLW